MLPGIFILRQIDIYCTGAVALKASPQGDGFGCAANRSDKLKFENLCKILQSSASNKCKEVRSVTEFESIYRRYFHTVERYLLALCHDAHLAEELTAQVFFQAMKAFPKFRGDCDIRTWLCAMAKNTYLSHLRRQRPTEDIDELPVPDFRPSIEEKIQDRQQAMEIHRALHNLAEPYKEVFSLRVFSQLSFADIGNIFGKTANWACVTYHRARQKIREEMEE